MVKWLNHLRARIQLARLLLDPPALFHHLHSLDWYRGALRDALPFAPEGLAGQSILEVGCATGGFCGDMAAMGAAVWGVDQSQAMVQRARQLHPAVRFDVASADALPFGDQHFDVVYAASLLNVVSHPAQSLREMARVCRPGGVLALSVPAAEFTHAHARRWAASQRLTPKDTAAYMAWHRLARKVDAAHMTQWLCEAGLAHAEVETKTLLGGLVRVVHVYPNTRATALLST